MILLLSPISFILAAVSIFCGTLMYYNMRHAIDLKHLRAEVSSVSLLAKSQSTNYLEGGSSIEIKDSIRKLTELRLSPIKKDLEELRGVERHLNCVDSLSLASKSKSSQISAERINYADIFLGARIESVECLPVTQQSKFIEWLSFSSNNLQNVQNILHPSVKPGSCFAFKGQEAKIRILLAEAVRIDAFELQHISRYESPSKETSSAPREFSILGIDLTGFQYALGDFEYNNSDNFQVFPITTEKYFRKILLHFRTNYGNPKYTCVYRIAVYGTPRQ